MSTKVKAGVTTRVNVASTVSYHRIVTQWKRTTTFLATEVPFSRQSSPSKRRISKKK